MAAICDVALDGHADGDDYSVLSADERAHISALEQSEAYEAVVSAINDAEAQ